MSALMTLLNRFQCYFLCVYKTVNQAPFRAGGGWGGGWGYTWNYKHPSSWNRGSDLFCPTATHLCPPMGTSPRARLSSPVVTKATEQHPSTPLPLHPLMTSQRLPVRTELLLCSSPREKPSAEPPRMSLRRSKPLCKTHLGPLNDFYTPGSFPDSHFIQLKSRSAPTLLKHGQLPPPSFDGDGFEPTF